jgi:putative isomerase
MNDRQNNYQMLIDAAIEHAREMFHEPAGCLKYPFVSPGGPYAGSLWDWDSYWASVSMLWIADITNDMEFRKKVLCYSAGALRNLFEYQAEDGSVPILLSEKDPDWFDSTRDSKANMAKPVLGQYCLLLDKYNQLEQDEAKVFLNRLKKYYECWERRYKHIKTGLYLWANDIAIGVDDDPATWGRPPFSSASIFLNCLLYADLKAAAEFAGSLDDARLKDVFSEKAERLGKAINEHCWDQRDGMYYSVDVLCQQNLSEHRYFKSLNCNLEPFWLCLPLKVAVWTSFMPLWCGLADKEKAERMVETLVDSSRFWTEYGLRSMSADEKMYSPDVRRGNPSNWLGPVWIIANYIIWKGLNNHGYYDIADRVSKNLSSLLANDYGRNGFLHEYYNPETGEGVCGEGFWNWNLLICLMNSESK